MPKAFLNTSSLKDALSTIQNSMPSGTSKDICHLRGALHRIISQDLISTEDLPPFPKSTVDGFAVKAADTFGASEGAPIYMKVIGEVQIGTGEIMYTTGRSHKATTIALPDYSAIRIPTGGMLPESADGVVMIEYTQLCEAGLDKAEMIELTRAVSPGENVIQAGEDVKCGDLLFPKGHRLRSQDIGVLAGLGITKIQVYCKPKVAIISSGPEICPIDQKPQIGQIRDINAYTLAALVQESGGEPLYMDICPDELERLKDTIKTALSQADCVLISGGSSVGSRDFTYQAISDLGPPGILVHGLSIRPGKPTIIGQSGKKPIIGLPGHPASAMIVANEIVCPIIYRLAGASLSSLEKQITDSSRKLKATLTRNISSPPGKEDFVRVALSSKKGHGTDLLATPIFGKSGLISTLIKAHGILKISTDSEGAYEGDEVEILLP